MAAVGSHLTLMLLTDSSQQQPVSQNALLKSLSVCLKKYSAELLRSDSTPQTGLTSSYYLAVLPDQTVENTLQKHHNSTHKGRNLDFGEWHLLKTCSREGVQTPRRKIKRKEQNLRASISTSHGGSHSDDVQFHLSPLEKMVDTLHSYLQQQQQKQHHQNRNDDNSVTLSPSECLTQVATGIHKLLDRAPNKPNEHTLVDVLWIVGESLPSSPHLNVDLFGALLRLKKWHSAHLMFITDGNTSEDEQLPLYEWQEAVDVDVICRASDWRAPSGVVWRGSLNFTEHKHLKQTFNHSATFPGFTLSLCSDTALSPNAPNIETILPAVGIGSLFLPSHLEVLQVICVSTLPLFWVSPLHCKLSLSSTNCPVSKDMFQSLFGSDKGLGLLVCLCQSECHEDNKKKMKKKTAGHTTTADWIEYIQEKDEEDIMQHSTQVSPLAVYESGPVLLLTSDGSNVSPEPTCNEVSCDAWFLWKPEAIDTGLFAQLKSRKMGFDHQEEEEEDKKNDVELCHSLMKLPILNSGGKQTTATGSTTSSRSNFSHLPSRRDLHHLLSQLPHELERPPTEWPEIKALKTHEWIQRKMIRRLATPDLMFGRMVAPPPTSITTQLDSVSVTDVLSCFTERGAPATTSELSPIAMNDPRQLTRVHDPVEAENISYGAIMFATPRSKKQFHGVNYCLTTDDTSLDVRLTKIQQRCLISERSSHCSTVFTPKAERARQQSRRMKAAAQSAQAAGKKKQEEEEGEKSEEREQKKDENGSTLMDQTEAVQVPDSTGTISDFTSSKSEPGKISKKGVVLKPPSTGSQYKGGPIRLTRSPVVNIPRARSLRNRFQKTEKGSATSDEHSQATDQQKTVMKEHNIVVISQNIAGSDGTDLQGCASVPGAVVGTSGDTQPDTLVMEMSTTHCDSNAVTSSSVVCSDQQPESGYQHVLSTMSEYHDQSPMDSVDESVIVETNQTLRRSPRLKKWRPSESGTKSEMKSGQSSSSISEQRKDKNLKTQLGQEVVKALKEHDMPRSHPCFRRCYARLFKLSKSFLKDMKEYARTKTDMREEMKRVVQLNAPQVIQFEFKINQAM